MEVVNIKPIPGGFIPIYIDVDVATTGYPLSEYRCRTFYFCKSIFDRCTYIFYYAKIWTGNLDSNRCFYAGC